VNKPRARRPEAVAGSLQDLGDLRRALQAQQAEAAARREREAAAAREAERQRQLFAHSVGPVHALPDRGRAELDRPRPAPEPRQRQADEQAALREALSDEVDVESLLLTDDGLSYRRPGIAPDVVNRLRRGQWAIQRQIDLHGLTRDEAREALADFVRTMHRQGQRCLRVVHGKGHGSPGRQPVLKAKVQRWLAQCREVIAFTQASGPQGGAGALIVLLDNRG
jgi:DNA-nicking Smr family endonuclease